MRRNRQHRNIAEQVDQERLDGTLQERGEHEQQNDGDPVTAMRGVFHDEAPSGRRIEKSQAVTSD